MNDLNAILPILSCKMGSVSMNAVSGRALHQALGIGRDFTNWMKEQIQRAKLLEHEDFEVYAEKGENPLGGRPTMNYMLTLDAAKCVGMMSGGENGVMIRKYFLACEKALKAKFTPLLPPLCFPPSLTDMGLAADLKASRDICKILDDLTDTQENEIKTLRHRAVMAERKLAFVRSALEVNPSAHLSTLEPFLDAPEPAYAWSIRK